jgi:hypothetical protein
VAVILLGGEHANELTAAVAEIAKFLDFPRRQRAHDGGDHLTEMGEDARVDGIGFGELPSALGEVADLSGVDDDGGQIGSEQGADRSLLIRARRLEHDALGSEGSNPGDELFDACGGVAETLLDSGGSNVSVKEIFANIDADEDVARGGTHGKELPNHKKNNEDRRLSCSSW